MIDDSTLRRRLREAFQSGALPRRLPDRLLGGSATGRRCAVCGESTDGGIEMELVFSDDSAAAETSYYAHPHCLSIFHREVDCLSAQPMPRGAPMVLTQPMAETLERHDGV